MTKLKYRLALTLWIARATSFFSGVGYPQDFRTSGDWC
jgi:hypothetical protein